MKNIKTFIIGFLSATCLFLIIGAGIGNEEVGRYQISTTSNNDPMTGRNYIYSTIIDTKTGNVISAEYRVGKQYTRIK
tara:strand:- start:114 stop:347 length:234 start_codon:yes stop_codon:yes gene_type:complete